MVDAILGDMFLARGEGGWHRKGKVFSADQKITTREAVIDRGMDYPMKLRQLFADIDGEFVGTDTYGIFRGPVPSDPSWKQIGTSTKEYTVLSNMEIADILDQAGISREWPLETVGVFDDGGKGFFTYRLPTVGVMGDEHACFFSVVAGHDGTRGVNTLYNRTRIVCKNTSGMAEEETKISLMVKHSSGVKQDFALAVDLISAVKLANEHIQARMERMAKSRITAEGMKKMVEAAYPMPKKAGGRAGIAEALKAQGKIELLDEAQQKQLRRATYTSDQAIARAAERRNAAVANYERICSTPELMLPALRGTVYAAYNAITEVENWRRSPGQDEGRQFESVLVGERAKFMQGAWEAAKQLSK